MVSRYFEAKDYENLLKWWKFWRFPAPSLNSLPTTGMIVNLNGVDAVCGFIYLTNSNMCWLEFIVSNPDVKNKEDREMCINECINRLCDLAKEMGYVFVYTSLKNENLQNKYLSCGFLEASSGCKEYIKIL